MNYEKVLGERLIPTYEELKSGLIRLIDEGKISREDAARVLPELRESEDEKIRMWLIDCVKATHDCYFETVTREQVLSYLEKQKEQKPQVFCEAKAYDLGYKQGKEDAIKEQKPAWSEEDEEMLSGFLHKLEVCDLLSNKENAWIVRKLKSLRPQPQKLEDWTEEDEGLLGDVLGCITLVQTYKACGDLKDFKMKYTGEELRSFVRSLKSRPRKQPRWKPSEEQMGAFRGYIEDFQARAEAAVGGWNNFDVMIRLYEQLKKLM